MADGTLPTTSTVGNGSQTGGHTPSDTAGATKATSPSKAIQNGVDNAWDGRTAHGNFDTAQSALADKHNTKTVKP